MENIIGIVCILILIAQITIIIPLLRIFHINEKLESTNLLLTVIANKMGATDQDVKEAHGKTNGNL